MESPIRPATRTTSQRFTLIELLVVVAIIAILASILLPVLSVSRAKAQSKQCMNNMKQVALAFTMYTTDNDDMYPAVRWDGAPRLRWQHGLADYTGKIVENDGAESTPGNGNRIVNKVFQCPSISLSNYQLDGANRGDFLRTGSYGYNWATFGPFPQLTADFPRLYPVREARITHQSSTIIAADAFGDQTKADAIHAYTLDGPRLLNNNRPGSLGGGHCPADPRHLRKFNAAFADGHARELSMRQAGYNADHAEDVPGNGNPELWNGFGDPSITGF